MSREWTTKHLYFTKATWQKSNWISDTANKNKHPAATGTRNSTPEKYMQNIQ